MDIADVTPDSPAHAEHRFDGAALPFVLAEMVGSAPCDRGVKNLMIAVMEDAIRCFLSKNDEDRRDAEDWMTSEDRGYVFDFRTLCDVLDLDGRAVFEALRRFREVSGFVPARKIRTRGNNRRRGTIRPNRVRRRNGSKLQNDIPMEASAA
jgi:hypothetical protein